MIRIDGTTLPRPMPSPHHGLLAVSSIPPIRPQVGPILALSVPNQAEWTAEPAESINEPAHTMNNDEVFDLKSARADQLSTLQQLTEAVRGTVHSAKEGTQTSLSYAGDTLGTLAVKLIEFHLESEEPSFDELSSLYVGSLLVQLAEPLVRAHGQVLEACDQVDTREVIQSLARIDEAFSHLFVSTAISGVDRAHFLSELLTGKNPHLDGDWHIKALGGSADRKENAQLAFLGSFSQGATKTGGDLSQPAEVGVTSGLTTRSYSQHLKAFAKLALSEALTEAGEDD